MNNLPESISWRISVTKQFQASCVPRQELKVGKIYSTGAHVEKISGAVAKV